MSPAAWLEYGKISGNLAPEINVNLICSIVSDSERFRKNRLPLDGLILPG